ncbi:MAG: hypothetical protein GBAus27B_000016 [Mycoplasmataceae bacterium]|nr:MAG: hypothetical protein GBAus27B_000016 [Mycoplasmataceae bacterium]
MNKKEICDVCQKKEIECGNEGVYLGGYQRIHICYDCYDSKEQWYLNNYDFIYSYSAKQYEGKNTGYVKTDNAPCYAGKKDSGGEVLKQQDCSHCSPWKFKDENINSDINDKNKSEQNISNNRNSQYFSSSNFPIEKKK